jgi:hypothetical protein
LRGRADGCVLLFLRAPFRQTPRLVHRGARRVCVDTALLLVLTLPDFDTSLLIDIAFHFWVLYYLIRAGVARGKLKQLAEQPAPVDSSESASAALVE